MGNRFIRNIDDAAMRIAKSRADLAGLSVGIWITRCIFSCAGREIGEETVNNYRRAQLIAENERYTKERGVE